MKIGFDAKRAFCNHSGLGNYSRTLLSNLFEFYPENEYFLYTPSFVSKKGLKIFGPKAPYLSCFSPKVQSQLIGPLWRSLYLPFLVKKNTLDIYHGLSHEIPFDIFKQNKKIKKIVTVHDLIYLRYPEFFKAIDRQVYDLKCRYACQYADKIVAISSQTKQDLIEFFKIPESKIEVIYQPCSSKFFIKHSLEEIEKIKKKYHLSSYCLFVSDIAPRKNCLRLINAFSKAIKDQQGEHANIELILVGQGKDYKEYLKRHIQQHNIGNVRFLSDVESEELPFLYQGAKIFIYPSLFEGFGIPLVEALYSHIPIITSLGNPFEEIVKDAALLIDPLDEESLSSAIQKLLRNAELGKELSEKGKRLLSVFSPEQTAKRLQEVYLKCL